MPDVRHAREGNQDKMTPLEEKGEDLYIKNIARTATERCSIENQEKKEKDSGARPPTRFR